MRLRRWWQNFWVSTNFSIPMGMSEKSTRQIVIDNFEYWTASTKIEMILEASKWLQNLIIWKDMNIENRDVFNRPCAVVVPNFQLYAIRRSITSLKKAWNLINDLFLLYNYFYGCYKLYNEIRCLNISRLICSSVTREISIWIQLILKSKCIDCIHSCGIVSC